MAHWGDILQMAVLELIRKVCRANPGEKGKYIKIILALLQSTSTAVVYECAVTLVSLSNAPTAITAAANCYCQMLVSQSDNNVKLIVLDRLQVRIPTHSSYNASLTDCYKFAWSEAAPVPSLGLWLDHFHLAGTVPAGKICCST